MGNELNKNIREAIIEMRGGKDISDEEIREMYSNMEMFQLFLNYNGISGYEYTLLHAIENIWGINLTNDL